MHFLSFAKIKNHGENKNLYVEYTTRKVLHPICVKTGQNGRQIASLLENSLFGTSHDLSRLKGISLFRCYALK